MTADRITGDIRTTLRHDSAHKHVAGSAVYVDEEILKRHSPVRGHTRQFHISRQRDQHRRQVADR